MKYFGSSGIRGLAFQKIGPELAMKVGCALGTMYSDVVVARDPRLTGEALSHALFSGLLATGCRVTYVGMASTPTLAHAARDHEAGAMLTASHNPPPYNGIKLWNPSGMAFDADQMERMEELIDSEPQYASWSDIHPLVFYPNAVKDHIEAVVSSFEPQAAKGLKVVVDCGNGATSHTSPFMLEALGCSVVSLNCHPDGLFPGRGSEPTSGSLEMLCRTVVSTGADLGIAHDGDGDRMMVVDDTGTLLSGDELLAMFMKLSEAKRAVTPINASMLSQLYNPDVEISRTKVGDVFVGMEMEKIDASFGGEPSGTWIFRDFSLCPDGIFAAARICASLQDRKLSDLKAELPEINTIKQNFDFKEAFRTQVKEGLASELESIECTQLETFDGWRLNFEDGWFLVRLSGTEPKIRATAEAETKVKADDYMARAMSIVDSVLISTGGKV